METPNLALVLEFMDMSLFEALHIKTVRIVDWLEYFVQFVVYFDRKHSKTYLLTENLYIHFFINISII